MYQLKVPSGINKFMYFLQCLASLSSRGKIFLFIFYASFPLSLGLGAFSSRDREEFVFSINTFITAVLQVVKLFFILCRWREILSFIKKVDLITIDYQDDYNEANKKFVIFMRFVQNLLLIFSVIMGFVHAFFGVLEEKLLCCNIAFPLDWKNDQTAYWLAFTYIFIETVVSTIIFLFDFIIWYMMLSFAVKYELLGNEFRRMGIVSPNKSEGLRKLSETEKQNLFCQDFYAAVESHQNIRE